MFKEVSTAFPLFSLSLETFVACCKGLKVMSDEKQKDDSVLAVVAKQDMQEVVVSEAEEEEEVAVEQAGEQEDVEDDEEVAMEDEEAEEKEGAVDKEAVENDPPSAAKKPRSSKSKQLTLDRALGKQEAVAEVSSKLFMLPFPKSSIFSHKDTIYTFCIE